MKINFDKKNILYILNRYTVWFLWAFLLLIILSEGFVLKNSVGKYLASNGDVAVSSAQLVRVNFEAYQKIENRLKANESFVPAGSEGSGAFGLVIKESN